MDSNDILHINVLGTWSTYLTSGQYLTNEFGSNLYLAVTRQRITIIMPFDFIKRSINVKFSVIDYKVYKNLRTTGKFENRYILNINLFGSFFTNLQMVYVVLNY